MERKETDIISGTDMNLVSEVEQQYYDVLKILIDPELEGLKSRIQVISILSRFFIPIWQNILIPSKTISENAKWIKEIYKAIKPELPHAIKSSKMNFKGQTKLKSIWKKWNMKPKIWRKRKMMSEKL